MISSSEDPLVHFIENLDCHQLPLPAEVHFHTSYRYGKPEVSHFYLEEQALNDPSGLQICPKDWKRLAKYIEDNNFADITIYNKFYQVKTLYEPYLEVDEVLRSFRYKYRKKNLQELFEKADFLESKLNPKPEDDPLIVEITKKPRQFTKERAEEYRIAYGLVEEKLALRDPNLLEGWKRKITRYRLAISQRAILDFESNPLSMLKFCWFKAMKTFEVRAEKYDLDKPNVLEQTRRRKHNKLRRELKLPGIHHFLSADHKIQWMKSRVFTYSSRQTQPLDTRKEYLERLARLELKNKQEKLIKEENEEIAKKLGLQVEEFEDFCEDYWAFEEKKEKERKAQEVKMSLEEYEEILEALSRD